MARQDDIIEQERLLGIHRLTLSHYLQQMAMHGRAYAPPSIMHGILEARSQIRRIKEVLIGWGYNVEDHPNELEETSYGSGQELRLSDRLEQTAVQEPKDRRPGQRKKTRQVTSQGTSTSHDTRKQKMRRVRLTRDLFDSILTSLHERYDEQRWWVRTDKYQQCIEAILSTGTSRINVDIAIENLVNHQILNPNAIIDTPEKKLANLILICGRSELKASSIKAFTNLLRDHYELDINKLLTEETIALRRRLLSVKGIGRFTCDNMLLYVADRPKLPINNQMKKVFLEHYFIGESETYDAIQSQIEEAIPLNTSKIIQFDVLIYRIARDYCHTTPHCEDCPMKPFLSKYGPYSQRYESGRDGMANIKT
jgi:endonuclease-3 related protein